MLDTALQIIELRQMLEHVVHNETQQSHHIQDNLLESLNTLYYSMKNLECRFLKLLVGLNVKTFNGPRGSVTLSQSDIYRMLPFANRRDAFIRDYYILKGTENLMNYIVSHVHITS